ncbi:PIN domain nuclease [Pleurocapsa sp. CCALA 161]|uniref:type II toxin-antitoxin system VapC family toxin n=1 Tax=Pleurocapsa sp. CCALA 161 TaxID=2107688 RepID=UPI000D04C9AA|nr:type II toxin-antitoxin system VapC family toxin [Pleurocapsa sp. CCALA 161]PSB05796.1 PIN domain nuclease [Pleurocapsa sp. CCALA 161]
MNLLLDTHTFLWFVNDNPKLSDRLKDLIEDTNNVSYLSIASLWEMSIKFNLGKLTLDPNYEEFVEREVTTSTVRLLNIELEHLRINSTLPFHHRDPFDRLIIAQSIAEEIPIVSVDSAFDKYSVALIN